MHIKGKYSWLKHLDFMMLDIFSLVVAFVLAIRIRFGDFSALGDNSWQTLLLIACLIDLLVMLFTNPFSGIFRRYGSEELLKSIGLAGYNGALLFILLYVLKLGMHYSRLTVFIMYALYFVLSLTLRMIWKAVLRSDKAGVMDKMRKSIFVVGTRENMSGLLRSINSGFFKEYAVQGICIVDGEPDEKVTAQIDELDERGKVRPTLLEFRNATATDGIVDYVLKKRIGEVYIGVKPSSIDTEVYRTLIENGKGIHLGIRPMIGFDAEEQFITTVGTYKALGIGMHSVTGKQLAYQGFKRLMDILFGLAGLIILLPLMLLVKISNLLTGDTKSIFYTHVRVGLNGRPFKMYKFRSMVWNADEVLTELLKDPKYAKEWADNQKLEDDPRITKMGKFLRKTSLDEIPQFLNVLKGDMSVIGPRPLVVGELEEHGGLQLYNHVKPGITGWWGCNGRSNTTYDERLELEYYYVKNCSLWLDVLCVIKTMVALVKRDGAV